MKLKFKEQAYQTDAVNAVINCFKGQPNTTANRYRIDPGKCTNIIPEQASLQQNLDEGIGFKNTSFAISEMQILKNIQEVQRKQNLAISSELIKTNIATINLDIEMETGTGKTYCYIKTMFEMNKLFGWNKFIVVVPSIAIREGIHKSLQITADHFQEKYHKRARFFIYNSKNPTELIHFSEDAGISVMIINIQAFQAKSKENSRIFGDIKVEGSQAKTKGKRLIYEELDDFQSRRPIDVISANSPILILDEPQKMEGQKTLNSLVAFNPLFILRYSATHKTKHNTIHRLDALDAYNQKLVKKIAVRGISVKGQSGSSPYLYLESIEISKQTPLARIEIEVKQNNGIKRIIRKLKKGDNLYDISNNLDQYKDFVITDINANTDIVEFKHGLQLYAGDVYGEVNEIALRRIQIRETIKAHFAKEQDLYHKNIKVLSLFFIDKVIKYRDPSQEDEKGEYAHIFEEEYQNALDELKQSLLLDDAYKKYLDAMPVENIHKGYFSIDKKTKKMCDPDVGKKTNETNDVDAYTLILKDKERLLSFAEHTRFIFSHSALREGWDNPNVFVICTLKHSDNTISRRQEVGRGLRIAVDQYGDRQDDPATVHDTNVLTVVTNESYSAFVTALQKDIAESLSARPRLANEEYFTGKILHHDGETVEISPRMARQIHQYLIKNDYVDVDNLITKNYHDALENETLSPLPEELEQYNSQIFLLIDSVFSDAQIQLPDNDRATKKIEPNDNFNKKEFKELWDRINYKSVYTVHFDSDELIKKCIEALNAKLIVEPLQYTLELGEQRNSISYDQTKAGDGFKLIQSTTESSKHSIHSNVSYDLIGKIGNADDVKLTRKTVAAILSGIRKDVFGQFVTNPESFIAKAINLIKAEKATVIIEHLSYDMLNERYDRDIFTKGQSKQDFNRAGEKLKRHIYDYVITDSKSERTFVENLDVSSEVVVYAKLPRGFFIPTPIGNYNPDWAIAFKEGTVKHIYFVAETKNPTHSMELLELDLRGIEKKKTECARKFFDAINEKINPKNVKYDVVDSYGKLMEIVGLGSGN